MSRLLTVNSQLHPEPALRFARHVWECQLTQRVAGFNIFSYGFARVKRESFGTKHGTNPVLGSSRLDPHRGPGHLALRRQHAVSGADHSARHAIYFGLRHRAADAGQSSGGRKPRDISNAYGRDEK